MHQSMISVALNAQVVSSSLQKIKAIAFVNSKYFQSRSIKAGIPVIISFTEQNLETTQRICAATLWPSSVISDSQIAVDQTIRESGIPIGQAINIAICEELIHEASMISIQPNFQDNSLSTQLLEKLIVQQTGRYVVKGMELLISVLGKPQSCKILQIQTSLHCEDIAIGFVTQDTRMQIPIDKKQIDTRHELSMKSHSDLQIGGLESQLSTVRMMAQLALHVPHLLVTYGQKPPRGVLLYGPPGTGKTLLARKIAAEINASVHVINGPDFVSSIVGQSEAQLREIFVRAQKSSPSIVIIDEIDAICPRRDENLGESEKRVVGSFLTLLDGISADSGIFVIGCTNRPNSIDKALRRPGRFDKEIEIGIPNEANRLKILEVHLANLPHSLSSVDIHFITSRTHGYVGADIAALVKESAILALKRVLPLVYSMDSRQNDSNPTEVVVTISDFEMALHQIKPTALREISANVPSITWSDIGGYSDIKEKLREATELPLKHRDCFDRLGISPPRGLLLYGPPGCSKTLMAQAIANIQALNFIPVKGSELLRKWVGESERAVKEIFQKAKAAAPAIIFFDEMDALASSRESETESSSVIERVVAQLLVEMSGIHSLSRVTVLGATNRPDLMDPALFGTNRFDRVLYVHPPTHEDRKQILALHLKSIPNNLTDRDLEVLCGEDLSLHYSGADLKAVVNEATLIAIKRELQTIQSRPVVTFDDFQQAFNKIKPSITTDMMQFYQKWSEHQSKVLHV